MKLYGLTEAESKKAFESFAVDPKTGKKVDKIDYGQFVKLWYDYFGSADKKKPGSYLFGPW